MIEHIAYKLNTNSKTKPNKKVKLCHTAPPPKTNQKQQNNQNCYIGIREMLMIVETQGTQIIIFL